MAPTINNMDGRNLSIVSANGDAVLTIYFIGGGISNLTDQKNVRVL